MRNNHQYSASDTTLTNRAKGSFVYRVIAMVAAIGALTLWMSGYALALIAGATYQWVRDRYIRARYLAFYRDK